MIVVTLRGIIQGKKDILWSYIECFMQVVVEVKGVKEDPEFLIFKNDLLRDHPFRLNIGRKNV